MRLGEVLLSALKDAGARHLYGIPGDFILPFFEQVEQSDILPLVTLSHEPGIGFAADASARMSCKPAAVAVTYGAGALNLVNAVAGAYAERSPLFVIAGCPSEAERGSGFLLHHQAKTLDSQYRIFAEITCDQARITRAEDAPEIIARLIRSCETYSQPVLLELPRDMATEPCEPVTLRGPVPFEADAVNACAEEVLQRLQSAESPVLVVDVEIRRYSLEAEVAELAHRLNTPVVTTLMGRGLLAETPVPVLGTYLGEAGDPALAQLVEESDAPLLLGAILSDSNFGPSGRRFDVRKAMLVSNRQVDLGYHSYHNVPIGALVQALLDRLPETAARARPEPPETPQWEADDQPLTPRDIALGINEFLAESREPIPLASDIGDCLFTSLDITHTPMVAPGYYASMGFGVPAGIGVQLTTGQRPIILVGDGAFQMTGWELGNCPRLGLDPIVVLFNNRRWEMIRVFQPNSRCSELGDWHYAGLADELGGLGLRVATRRDFKAALKEADQARGSFVLIEAMLEPDAVSPTLRQFADRLQAKRKAAG
ncbi:indolepyruvate/phenylpyruvate decarboxylase [Saccharospirillum salsuginis]|uniref:Indolepyruvate/phenylpyruvate decarboxylase n=1 Tax=Saccharospirillum salsuginis TaxID=418750 RepID=A0A918NEH9_9GAMM|nr:indolepyruvate/phenylpyruvate decarboxylase [Saccharospirillum salsuginis]GGX61323.1 indolepyruvate/phenylpyruvate decarboxylase [Saccharospirillum salsuginis]